LRTLADVKYLTADYVAWYNQWRLMHALDESDPPTLRPSLFPTRHRPAGSQNPEGA
jgi:putative transposase